MIQSRIALDAMGGDHAPEETVRGALEAVQQDPDLHVVLVGQRERIERILGGLEASEVRLSIKHASQVVTGRDSPVEALRSKKDASIRVAAELVAHHEADALVAAGNTGATVACSIFQIRPLPGVRKPGIAVPLPCSGGGQTLVCDAGANIHCKPLHLYHYGIMAARYAERVMGMEAPRVGLMNIASEAGKGTALVRETARLFSSSSLNYVGHAEGTDVFNGQVDVMVCEGFVGNVVLKVAEGLFETIDQRLEEVVESERKTHPQMNLEGVRDFFGLFRDRMDWTACGGAPLLGLNGLVYISHGRSNARAIRNALLQAAHQHRSGVLSAMAEDVRSS